MGKESRRIVIQILLFIVTLITTTIAGAEWVYSKSIFMEGYTWEDFKSGFAFSIPLLAILTVHEFGHYFVAIYHKVKTSLPYYIPIPPIPGFFSLGTFGAVIRLRSRPYSNIQHFDIGLAGPLAGFILAVALLIYAFATLPPADYIFQFHPDYAKYGVNYAEHVYTPEYAKQQQGILDVRIGKTLIFWIAEQFVSDPSRIPNSHELMHYPLLFAVFFSLFITSLNLLPIGQLDGGHVVYGLFGYKKHKIIASIFFIAIIFYAGINNDLIQLNQPFGDLLLWTLVYILLLYFVIAGLGLQLKDRIMLVLIIVAIQFLLMVALPGLRGYPGWALMIIILGRVIGIEHPPSEIEQPLDSRRIILGWLTLLIFILCFSPAPLDVQLLY
jgi:membrane-associated protease RseP (regulator of RpoE activity)